MVKTTLWRALDKVLEPVGFVMSGRNWERLVGQYRDHIHLQTVSGSGTRAYVATTDTVHSLLDKLSYGRFLAVPVINQDKKFESFIDMLVRHSFCFENF